MQKKQIIIISILIFLGMILASYAITCGIYAVTNFEKERKIKKQKLIEQQRIKEEEQRLEQERLNREREERRRLTNERLRREREERQRLAQEKIDSKNLEVQTHEKRKEEIEKQIKERKEALKEEIENKRQRIKIFFKEPSSLSYKSKEEIYNIRINAVNNSIFRDPNYYPSNEVFGQIESNKPWNSMRQCLYDRDGRSDINGPSEEARYIDNPEILVAIEYSFYGHSCEKRGTHELAFSRPEKIMYNKDKNEIELVYGGLPYCNSGTNTWFNFKGLNARDLGYKYMYIDRTKSSYYLNYVEQTNASNSVVELQDYIHVGGSCGHPSGCNNGSPNQPPLNFYYPCTFGNAEVLPNQTIYIKLWKNKPNSPQDKPDITEKIVLRKVWVDKNVKKRSY